MTGDPGDYVFSTGQTFSIKDLLEISYSVVGINLFWDGKKGTDHKGNILVNISESYSRSFDNNENVYGIDPKMEKLGWKPQYSLEDIMREMITFDKNNTN